MRSTLDFCLIFFFFILGTSLLTQGQSFTNPDSLRGSIGEYRKKWDVLHYDITIEPNIAQKTIAGIQQIQFADSGVQVMQIDLQEPMKIDSILLDTKRCSWVRNKSVFFVTIPKPSNPYPTQRLLRIHFSGKPTEATYPPWDGGWVWQKDRMGNAFVSVACQGIGASVWYPCKDHQSDEPDQGARLQIIVPDNLQAVGNGRLVKKTPLTNNRTKWIWEVLSPINSYNIIPYIGRFTHIQETYAGLDGSLDLDYYVLTYNEAKAKQSFKDVPRMLKAFEWWFGPYPFYKDGFKFVEAPYLGMEHQSAIAYGNEYKKGYLGTDLSNSGWGLKWDYIIVHEAGHEWFGNSITTADVADMWVQEGFTNYSEVLFTEFHFGKEAGNDYAIGLRSNIMNDKPIIGSYGVQKEGSSDMYYKGANLIHTIRQLIQDDTVFRKIMIGLNKTFRHSIVTTQNIEQYISNQTGKDLSKIFDQYLRTTRIPVLEYATNPKFPNRLYYRWTNTVPGFQMPVLIERKPGIKEEWLVPQAEWQFKNYDGTVSTIKPNRNFYINARKVELSDNQKTKMIQ